MRLVECHLPAALVHITAFGMLQLPALGRDERHFVTGNSDGPKMPTNPAGLGPEGEGPALGMRGAIVLLGENVALGVHDSAGERRGPAATHAVELFAFAAGGPQRGVWQPLVPERNERAGRLVMQPEELSQRLHLGFFARDDESGKVVGNLR